MNVTVFDCETGGLDFQKNPITEIALRTYSLKDFKMVEEFQTLIKPYGGLEVTERALEVSMVDKRALQIAPDIKSVVKVLIEFFKKSRSNKTAKTILSGHNVAFDIAFLKHLFVLESKDLSEHVRSNNNEILTICTQRLAESVWPGERVRLGDCCERLGIKLVDAHGAMADTEATALLLKSFTLRMRQEGGVEVSTNASDNRLRNNKHFQF